MYYGGCDIGSLTAKAVIIDDSGIVASAVTRAGVKPAESARKVMDMALDDAGLNYKDLKAVTGTGYGRELIDFINNSESEIICHGKGAWAGNSSIKTVIDIGGQDAKVIKLDDHGNIIRYIYNDKCASGTGRFLEIVSNAMDVEIENLGDLENESKKDLTLSNQCVIFAETEIVSLISEGENISDIVKALHNSLAGRVASLAKSIGVEGEVTFTGGVAKNSGVFRALSELLSVELNSMRIDPQINGAMGAALIARENAV